MSSILKFGMTPLIQESRFIIKNQENFSVVNFQKKFGLMLLEWNDSRSPGYTRIVTSKAEEFP